MSVIFCQVYCLIILLLIVLPFTPVVVYLPAGFRRFYSQFPYLRRFLFRPSYRMRIAGHLENFAYYKRLHPEDQEKFVERVCFFLLHKDIESESVLITEEIAVKIAASAIQLYFGHPEYDVPSLETIVLAQKRFIIGRDKRLVESRIHKNKLFLSLEALERGYADAENGYNPGLYAFATLLQNSVTEYDGDDPTLTTMLRWWEKGASRFSKESGSRPGSPLAEKSEHENFFGKCIVLFFEKSEQLKKTDPELYNSLCLLLRQDPLEPGRNFADQEQAEAARYWRLQHRTGRISLSAFLISLLMGTPLVIVMLTITAFPSWAVPLVALGIAALIYGRQFSKGPAARKIKPLSLLGVWGAGAMTTVFLLAANFSALYPEVVSERMAITDCSVETNYRYSRHGRRSIESFTYEYTLENDAYDFCGPLRSFKVPTPNLPREGYLTLHFRRGLLGLKVLTEADIEDPEGTVYSIGYNR